MQEDKEQTLSFTTDDDEESELASLLGLTISDVVASMSEEEAAVYIDALFEGGDRENAHALFATIVPTVTSTMAVPNYRPDQAVREASLAKKEYWQPREGEVTYQASNMLEVYLGTPEHPLELPQALRQIRQLSESTVLTSRILLGLWNARRYNNRASKNGSVAVLLEEILQWQGIQKHRRLAYPGATKRYTDGYRVEQKQRVVQDLALLASCNVRGTCRITVKGKAVSIEVDGPYLRYSIVSRKVTPEDKVIIGFLVSPGDWISTYEQHQSYSFAEIDSQIFTLNPQNDRYALRLALYLTERWREQASQGIFSTPIIMADLLAASMIEVDERHLTSRFAPKIEEALHTLENMNIIGRQNKVVGVDTTQARWGKDWLAAQWEILPPLKLIQEYKSVGRRSRKARTSKSSEQQIELF